MKYKKYNILKKEGGLNMNQQIAVLTKEQQQKIDKMESELGCVLVAYEKKETSQTNVK